MKPIAKKELLNLNGVNMLTAFVLITICFALWGFANNVTSPLVQSFTKIFNMSVSEGILVPVVFNLGYFLMAIPAAIFIQRYSFRSGVLVGLALFSVGSLLFLPARYIGLYPPFLLAYFILTCGLSFLETSCNPYVYCMGKEDTAVWRLNLAQAFNPIGNLLGLMIVVNFVQEQLSPMSSAARSQLTPELFNIVKDHDLEILIQPYLFLAAAALLLLIFIRFTRLPKERQLAAHYGLADLRASVKKLLKARNYREGVVAQFFYVGAQVSCWTFIIQYGIRVFLNEGLSEKAAELEAYQYSVAAMVFFALGRFACVFLMKYVSPPRLLSIMAIVAVSAVGGAILFPDRNGLYCLILVSACMSLMFPTIYGLSLKGIQEDIKIAGAGHIMAILGGSVFPPLQALIIDHGVTLFGVPVTNLSYIIPLLCFCIVALYGHRTYVRQYILHID